MQMKYRKTISTCLWTIALSLALSSCGILKARSDLAQGQLMGAVFGRVISADKTSGPIVVFAKAIQGPDPAMVKQVVLDTTGPYEMLLPEGQYRLLAFEDSNRNLRLDPGEAVGAFSDEINLKAGQIELAVDIFIDRSVPPGDSVLAAPSSPKRQPGLHSSNAGAIANLDDLIFSSAYGEDQGYWEPLRFFQEAGANIYALEPYDPTRIPILFVHGARGSPQDWKYAFQHLDRKRYQAWFFHYPTAISLNVAAFFLAKKINDMYERHHFPRLHLIAHSAGGLVVREFLLRFGQPRPEIETFISISTPWSGESLAELGVRHSPVVLPSWIDMQPDSSFMKGLYEAKMPGWINHHLLFGFRGGINLVRSNNDGALLLSSLLEPRAQQEARSLAGFDEDHLSILVSPSVMSKISSILDEADEAYRRIPKSKMRISTAGMSVKEIMQSQLSFVLIDQAGRHRTITLPPGEDSIELSDLPVGDYRLRLRALGARGEPDEISIHVGENVSAEATFQLQPRDGALCGLIHRQPKEPADKASTALEPITVDSIMLSGNGIQRETPPSFPSLNEIWLDRDFRTLGLFCFLDLPEGEYSVDVRNDGEVRQIAQTVKRGSIAPPANIRY